MEGQRQILLLLLSRAGGNVCFGGVFPVATAAVHGRDAQGYCLLTRNRGGRREGRKEGGTEGGTEGGRDGGRTPMRE